MKRTNRSLCRSPRCRWPQLASHIKLASKIRMRGMDKGNLLCLTLFPNLLDEDHAHPACPSFVPGTYMHFRYPRAGCALVFDVGGGPLVLA